MNKTAIKNFAVWARRKLIADITYKAGLIGVSENGIAEPLPQSTKDMQFFDIGTKNYAEVSGNEIVQRNALVSAIKAKERDTDYKTAFQNVVEEVAYTWFNRLIAVRFMEVNDYLPSRVRVLSSENSAKLEPDFVTTPFDTDLDFTQEEQDRVLQLKDENKLDELFCMLFIKQCNKLNEILPELFEKTADYSELLLTISFTDKDGVVYHLTHDIAEDDFNVSKEGQVEIIGWMYQYYNTEPKDEVFALLKKNVKITKERIPAATQLFTPDWIVRYMVENSLGRLWLEGHENASLKSNWKYYLEEAQQEPDVEAQLAKIRDEYKTIKPEDIKVIDPCMGSGHILVYAFEVLMQIYTAQGYVERYAAKSIIENNIFGLDIDTRAYQLAYFAVMMKARQYNRRILNGEAKPNLFAIDDSSALKQDIIDFIANGNGKLKRDLQSIADDLYNAKEYGSIIDVAPVDFAAIYARIEEIKNHFYEDIFGQGNQRVVFESVLPIIKQAETMAQKYDVVVTNPPYMGSRKSMNPTLKKYVETRYPNSKSDLYTVFIERCASLSKLFGLFAMITQQSYMFTDDYKELRSSLLESNHFINMAHLGSDAFSDISGEVVQTTAFVIQSHIALRKYNAKFSRLVDYSCNEKPISLLKKENWFYCSSQQFENVKAMPFSYWLSERMRSSFSSGIPFEEYGNPRAGITTGENDRFMRNWQEIENNKIGFLYSSVEAFHLSGRLYIPYNKGGAQNRWYGNNDYVLMFDKKNYDILSNQGNHLPSRQYYCQRCITWSDISGRSFAARYCDIGTIFDVKGSCGFPDEENFWLSIAFLNSKLTPKYIDSLNPTTTTQVGDLKRIPIIAPTKEMHKSIDMLAKECIKITKYLYDCYENSWDFARHPLIHGVFRLSLENALIEKYIEASFMEWEKECNNRFNTLQSNEEELNRIFIDIYGLQDELTPEVADKDVTVRKADLQRDIKSLISYAVGCMFGRYSLDVDGLAYAGGDWDDNKYTSFIPDADNCIPITDEDYFHDDIVGRFAEFIKIVYGADTLEENLDFIAKALGNKGNTSREVIRNYFLNDFIKDHIKIYQKRPIYWMFDSGKQNGFKALVYMHRWNADTTGNVRVEYLHKVQKVYESEIIRMQDTIENSTNGRDVAAAEKRKEKLTKQLKEAKDYDAKIAHLALSRIAIDLDDGVKVNYEKVQTGQDGKKIEILTKI